MAKTVTVKSGDTLSQILKDAGVKSYASSSTWNTVAQASGIKNPNLIYAGNKITIPDSILGTTSSSTPSTTSAPKPTSAPESNIATSQELTNYLNEQQQQLMDLQDYDPFEGDIEGSIDEAIGAITDGTEMPEAPDYTELFQTLREKYGLDSIEQGINEYKNLIRQEENLLMQQRNDIRQGQTRMGVIEGRIDKATQDRMEMMNWYKSNAQFLADMANSAYSYIEMVMNLEQMDYETAKERYDTNFNQRLQIYESIKQEAQYERDYQYQMMMDQQKLASTNLTMYMDLISQGQMFWGHLSSAQQAQIHKLEVQAGLPMGFLSNVKMQAGANILSTVTRVEQDGSTYADILYIDPMTGKVESESKYTGKTRIASSGGTTTSRNQYGYTDSQWKGKVADARSELAKLEKQYEQDIYESGGSTGTGKFTGDQVLADWEIRKANSEFNAKYGSAGTDLLYEALTTGGYKTWDFKNNKVAPLSILGI